MAADKTRHAEVSAYRTNMRILYEDHQPAPPHASTPLTNILATPLPFCLTISMVQRVHYKEITLYVCTVLPRCYALLAVTPPPPYFRAKLLYRVFHLHYTPPPPRAARPVCGTAVLARVRVLQV